MPFPTATLAQASSWRYMMVSEDFERILDVNDGKKCKKAKAKQNKTKTNKKKKTRENQPYSSANESQKAFFLDKFSFKKKISSKILNSSLGSKPSFQFQKKKKKKKKKKTNLHLNK